jgi:HEAT repeat protein
MIAELALVLLVADPRAGTAAPSEAFAAVQEPSAPQSQDRARKLYEGATAALDRRDWNAAADGFGEVAALKGDRADAALYWRAYALQKIHRRDEALDSLASLKQAFPRSKWVNDARALELEIRQASGQQPAVSPDSSDDLKLLALSGLMNADPDRALPLIKQMLTGTGSAKVREDALFVLAQSGSSEARQLLFELARGGANPQVQAAAVRYLGLFGGQESRQALLDIYTNSQNLEARKAVLNALMVAGDRARLAEIARQPGTPPELKQEAINGLGVAGGRAELAEIYAQDKSPEARRSVINALFVSGAVDQITALATKEPDPGLRREAIQRLGLMGGKTAPTLASIYANERDPQVKAAVLNAYFVQGNAAALVEIARKEPDAEMKKKAMQMLSLMQSKEATDYMLELLK